VFVVLVVTQNALRGAITYTV